MLYSNRIVFLRSEQTERDIRCELSSDAKNEVEAMVLLVIAYTKRDKKSQRFLQRNVFVYLCDIAAEFAGMLF